MAKKVLTKTCPSCDFMIINDDGEFECTIGKSKKQKILNPPLGKIKTCNLMDENSKIRKESECHI